MRRVSNRLFNSRGWIALSIGCSLFALYEAIEKTATGHPIEGILDLVLAVVFIINFLNRFRTLALYFKRLVN